MQTFDGNPKHLADFIKTVEEILLLIRNTDGTPYGQLLLRAIRNKIIGEANEALNTHLTPNIWDNIKDTLTNLYGDKRDESTIIRELYNTKQYNKNIEDLYKEITELQTTLLNNMKVRETNTAVLQAKKKSYKSITLDVFLTGLKEPLGSTIRAMRPENLPNALNVCQKGQKIIYNRPNKHHDFPYPRQFSLNKRNTPFQFQKHQNPMEINRSPYQYPRMITNHQQLSSSNNTFNNTPQNNNFNRHQPQIKDSNSRMSRQNTAMQRSNFNNQQSTQSRFGRQNYKIEEINNIDCHEEIEMETDTDRDTQNFQANASINPKNS